MIKLSHGDYIARMDSDDISLPNRLKTQIEYLEKHPNIEIIGMYTKSFGKTNSVNKKYFIKPQEIEVELLYNTTLIHPTVMFRKSFFKKKIF